MTREDIKEKAHQIAWETSKDYDPLLSKEAWCEMAALDMASWFERQDEKLDAHKVIEWLDEHIPTKFEDMQNYVNQFKEDFGL